MSWRETMSWRERAAESRRQTLVFLRARFDEALALGLLAACFWVALALLSYDPNDASLNTSTQTTTHNWLGMAGALVADLIQQLLGHAGWLMAPPLVALGWRRLRHQPTQNPNWRLLAGVGAVLLAAFGLALIGREASIGRPFPGGALGQLMADQLDAVLTLLAVYLPRPAEWLLALMVLALAGLASLFACGEVRVAVYFMVRLMVRTATSVTHLLAKLSAQLKNLRLGKLQLKQLPAQLLAQLSAQVVAFLHWLVFRLSALSAVWFKGRLAWQWPFFIRTMPTDAALYNATLDNADYQSEMEQMPPITDKSVLVEQAKKSPRTGKRAAREAQPSLGLNLGAHKAFELPPLRLLRDARTHNKAAPNDDALAANARLLETVLADFGVHGTITKVRSGPVVTLYELEPAAGVRSSRVVGLADDIARSMSAISARVAPVPGANAIGIELPNQSRELVNLRELLASADFESGKYKLTLALGKDIGGAPVIADLAKMPHFLVAGTTGSGKSVGINTMLLSLLYRLTPQQCRLILVDPKMLELSVYDGIPHLLAPVVTDPKKAVVALKWVVQEMENRYRKMAKIGVRNIEGYNERMAEAQRKGENLSRRVQTGFDPESGAAIYEDEEISPEILPFIVVVIDEMADLMMVAGKEIEAAVQRLAQMARAAGVHLITATQRPSVDVITGTIKANFPSRISFQVTSKIDSRTVLGEQGGEQLLGQGDMLFMEGAGRLQRVHGPFVSDREVEKVVNFLKRQATPDYIEQVTQAPEEAVADMDASGDSLYDEAVAIVTRDGRASTSYIQRRLQIGYNRAARLIEQMEEQGVVSTPNPSGKREILVGKH